MIQSTRCEQQLDELIDTPGALPLLQFVASKLWDGRDTTRKRITDATSLRTPHPSDA